MRRKKDKERRERYARLGGYGGMDFCFYMRYNESGGFIC